jgi:FG-GAP repeat
VHYAIRCPGAVDEAPGVTFRDGRRRAGPARFAIAGALGLVFALALASPAAALEHTLTAVDGVAGDTFGRSVASDGSMLVLGAPGDDGGRGSVYVFRRLVDTWALTAKLTAADGAAGDGLGYSVAIDGDTILAGAPLDDVGANADQGAAYTFARAATGVRTETAKLAAADGAAGDELGVSVAIDGDTILAGAPLDDVGANVEQGSAYTFARAGAAARTETANLTAADGAARDELGFSVALDGDTIVAGAALDTFGPSHAQGSAYTFARAGAAARTETAKLTATDGAAFDELGVSVAIDGDTILAGAPFATFGPSRARGSAYTFDRAGAAARTETAKLTATDGAAGDLFGFSVAIDGDTILAGAPLDDINADSDQGSASVFFAPVPPPPPPPPPPAKPVLSKLKISPSTFRRGSSLARISKSRKGTRISFALSATAKVKLSFAKAEPGRTVAKTCRKPSRSNRGKPRCTRYVTVGSLTVRGRKGANTVSFAGRLSRVRRLSPGSYKLTATPTDTAHNTGRPRTAKLKIVTR